MMELSVNMLLASTLFCSAGPGFLIRTVRKYRMVLLITDIIFSYIYPRPVFLRRRGSLL